VLTVIFSLDYIGRLRNQGEFYSLLVFALLGMMVMASANDLITLFVGMELMTITFYVLVGSNIGDQKSSEAGMKYLILGAASSAVLLYGMSLVYGAAGSVLLKEIAASAALSPALVVGVVLTLVGFSFKTASVPFHMWSPDVYEGAPVPITALLAMASKAAGFTVLVRVFLVAFPGIEANWIAAVCVLSAVSMILGNVIAIPQTNIKRMLAYSSIAQAGYMLSGLIAADAAGVKGILFTPCCTSSQAPAFCRRHRRTSEQELGCHRRLRRPFPARAAAGCRHDGFAAVDGGHSAAGRLRRQILPVCRRSPKRLSVGGVYRLHHVDGVGLLLPAGSQGHVYEGTADTAPFAVGGPLRWAAVVSMLLTILFGVYPAPLSEIANAAAKSLM
jgi:NADH-quinone oxidoreductase subunit N